MTDDQVRELRKVLEAVSLAADYHTKINEANRKVRQNEPRHPSPPISRSIPA